MPIYARCIDISGVQNNRDADMVRTRLMILSTHFWPIISLFDSCYKILSSVKCRLYVSLIRVVGPWASKMPTRVVQLFRKSRMCRMIYSSVSYMTNL